ncbi:MAG: UvrD-helicase domain-containing protein, partial [Firmicutes bacterium]|nr:UvrD-helicase domain-containing protein [Bacillota bacterium]
MNWTEKQTEAIYDRGNSLLLSAAAGSGKTAVLVERIISLLTSSGASLDRMLIVTFTKAAASEMRERLRKKLGDCLTGADEEKKALIKKQLSLIGRAEICTFDSFAQRLVRNYYHVIGVDPALKICDSYKSSILKNEAMDEMFSELYEKKDPDFLDFLDHYSNARTDKAARDLIFDLYGYTDTLPKPLEFLDSPQFDPDKLMALAGEFALLSLERSFAYCSLLKTLFEDNGMGKCLAAAKEALSDMDSMICGIKAGHTEEVMTRLCEYSFPRLAAGPKDEQEKKKALDGTIKAYWDKGAKEAVGSFKEAYKGISLARLEDEKQRLDKPISRLCALTRDFGRRYGEKKKALGFMDFSDGEHFALEILKNEDVRKECREKYRYIFVDEYQDCNPLQESLIEGISSDDNVFTVGDVKQSIYRFRHAEPGLFLSRYSAYKSGKENSKVIDLNSNFRSKKPIIDFVNRLFENLMTEESSGMVYDESAALKEGMPFEGPEECLYEPELYLVDTQGSDDIDETIADLKGTELEALNAAKIIAKYHDGRHMIRDGGSVRPLRYRDMVILLRSAKTKAEVYYEALTKAGIPVYLDRSEGYFDTPEIQVFVNLLKVLDNPRQDVPLISVLYFPSFGFSAEELAKIRIEGRRSGKHKMSFYEAFRYVSGEDSPLSEKCREVTGRLDGWRVKAAALPLADFLWDLLSESGILVFAAGLSSGEQRVANLRALVDKAGEFEKTNTGGIFSFISYIDSISGENSKVSTGQSSIAAEEDDVVRIMTVHKSKGLEFPFVLFASCGGRLSAGKDHPRAVFHKDLGTSMFLSNPGSFSYTKPVSFKLIEAFKKKEELAEEIRILYVAVTRAKDIFVMSASEKDAGSMVEKRDVFRIKASGCINFAQMALPFIHPGKVTVSPRSSFDISVMEERAADREKLKKDLENGFE